MIEVTEVVQKRYRTDEVRIVTANTCLEALEKVVKHFGKHYSNPKLWTSKEQVANKVGYTKNAQALLKKVNEVLDSGMIAFSTNSPFGTWSVQVISDTDVKNLERTLNKILVARKFNVRGYEEVKPCK